MKSTCGGADLIMEHRINFPLAVAFAFLANSLTSDLLALASSNGGAACFGTIELTKSLTFTILKVLEHIASAIGDMPKSGMGPATLWGTFGVSTREPLGANSSSLYSNFELSSFGTSP